MAPQHCQQGLGVFSTSRVSAVASHLAFLVFSYSIPQEGLKSPWRLPVLAVIIIL